MLGEKVHYAFNCDNVIELDRVVRNQIRDLRKDIELFGRITDDARNPIPAALKSEISNLKFDPSKNPWPKRTPAN
jgi:hypothetical protein